MTPPIVALAGHQLTKRFPGVTALDAVDLKVYDGEVHALVGENGAGKSTLVKIIAGVQQPDQGFCEFKGQRVTIPTARAASRLGIAVVHQEFDLVPDLSVSENIFLGRWSHRMGFVSFNRLHREAARLLASLNLHVEPTRQVSRLTVAQQQMVEIAKALSLEAKLLILDEPSAVLTPHELKTLFALIRRLAKRGIAIMYISHRLEEIFDICDRVTVLRDGQRIFTRPIDKVDRPGLIQAMVGRPMNEEFPLRVCRVGQPVLQLSGLSVRDRFQDVSLELGSGEVLGITGLVGAGRSSLLQAIFGALRTDQGTLSASKHPGPFASPRSAIRAGIAYLPEDRKLEGLLLHRSVRENVTLASLGMFSVGGFLNHPAEQRATRRLMQDLRIKAVSSESMVQNLSGGNQQKVLLARWMERPHRVILFDEPTRGIDVGAKHEIYNLINKLALDGVGILLVSSELPEVIGMCDRIAVMCEGRLAGTLDNHKRQVTQEAIMHLAAGTAR